MNVKQTISRGFFFVLSALLLAGAWAGTQTFAQEVRKDGETMSETRSSQKAAKRAAIADALGITVEDLTAAKEASETKAEFVEALGLAEEEYSTIKLEVKTEIATEKINEQVAAGEITQEEADILLEQIANGEFPGCNKGNRGADETVTDTITES